MSQQFLRGALMKIHNFFLEIIPIWENSCVALKKIAVLRGWVVYFVLFALLFSPMVSIAGADSITVTSPPSGVTWSRGDTKTIRWTSVGSIANVKIQLIDSSDSTTTIEVSTTNSGSYDWKIPLNGSTGSGYTVRVANAMSYTVRDDSAAFSIDNGLPPASITVTTPVGGENWSRGDTETIRWSSSGVTEDVKIEILYNDNVEDIISSSTDNTGSFNWLIPSTGSTGNAYKIRVASTTRYATVRDDSSTFSIDNGSPPASITVTTPVGGENWSRGDTETIRWTSSGVTEDVKIEVLHNDNVEDIISSSTDNTGSFNWLIPSTGSTGNAYKIRVASTTRYATVRDDSSTFSIDNGSPPASITVTTPVGGENWSRGDTETIRWTSSGVTEDVKIEVLYNDNVEDIISSSTDNTGSFNWLIPSTGSTGNAYKIRVASTTRYATVRDDSSTFSIDNGSPPASITVTTPVGGENWSRGDTETIRWSSSGVTEDVKIEILYNDNVEDIISSSTDNTGSFNWLIPSTGSTGNVYKIRVASTTRYATVRDDSSTFSIDNGSPPASITVTTPVGGENWSRGDTETIRWTSSEVTENVKIELLYDDNVEDIISSSTDNTGSFNWLIPSTGSTGNAYKIRVASTTRYATVRDDSSTFSIDNGSPPASITVTTPVGGENWSRGDTETIRWTSSGVTENVRIELLYNGSLNSNITDSTDNIGSFNWLIPSTGSTGNVYKIRVASTTRYATVRDDSNLFSIGSDPPSKSISVTSPNGGENFKRGSSYTIRWTSSDVSESVKIELWYNGALKSNISNSAPNKGGFVWNVPLDLPLDDHYKIRVASTDEYDVYGESHTYFSIAEGNPNVQMKLSVYNSETGSPVQGANVTIGIVSKVAGSEGLVVFDGMVLGEHPLRISATGYFVEASTINLTQKGVTTFQYGLSPISGTTGDRPAVVDVVSRYSGQNRKGVCFLHGVNFDVEFTAKIAWNNKVPGKVRFNTPKGLLDVNPSSGGNASFVLNMGEDIGIGGRLGVTAICDDGTESETLYPAIEIIPLPPLMFVYPDLVLGNQDFTYQIKLSIGIIEPAAQNVPEELPLFGGSTFGFSAKAEMAAVIDSSGTATYSVVRPKTENDALKMAGVKFDKDWKLGGEIHYSYIAEQNSWRFDGGHVTAGLSVSKGIGPSYTVVVVGPVPVPVYVRGEIFAELNGSLGLVRFSGENGWRPDGTLEPGAGGKAIAGVGVASLMAVEGYLGLKGSMTLGYPEDPIFREARIALSGGISLVTFFYVYEKPLWEYAWSWPGVEGQAEMRMPFETDALKNVNQLDWKPIPRKYRSGISPSRRSVKASTRSLSATLNGTEQTIPGQTDIYPYSYPSLISFGDELLLVWITDDLTKTENNRTSLVFSKYAGDLWTSVDKVFENETGDFYPSLAALGDRAVVAWQDSGILFSVDATMQDMLPEQEISVCTFNTSTDSWDAATRLTSNAFLDRSPVVAASSEKAIVVWVTNQQNDMLGAADKPNNLKYSVFNGTAWSQEQVIASDLKAITKTSLSFDNTEATFVFVVDGDGDISTVTDQDLYLMIFDGSSWSEVTRLTNDVVQDTNPQLVYDQNGDLLLVWYKDGNFRMVKNMDMGNSQCVVENGLSSGGADFRMAAGSTGQISIVWPDSSSKGQDIFMAMYDPNLSIWGKPVQVTNTEYMARSLATTQITDGSVAVAYNRVETVMTSKQVEVGSGKLLEVDVPKAGQTDLCMAVVPIQGNLSVYAEGITVAPAQIVVGGYADFTAIIRNEGLKAAENIAVEFYYGDPANGGSLIGYRQILTEPIVPGSSASVSVNGWLIPENPDANREIYVSVDPNMDFEDRDRGNNIAHLPVFRPDLAIPHLFSTAVGPVKRALTVTVRNDGTVASSNIPVTFKKNGLSGELLHEETIISLSAGESIDVVYEWDITGEPQIGGYLKAFAVVNGNQLIPEISYVNNSRTIKVFGEEQADSDGDGLSDDIENQGCTNFADADTDDDGILDGIEDANGNGQVDVGETNPCEIDSDSDGIQDGTELGYILIDVGSDTDTTIFQPDLDPGTTTDPIDSDSDGDGVMDGLEDVNKNGRLDSGESDPGIYDQAFGTLQVTIMPQKAIESGAMWNIDGGEWQHSGATVSGLIAGNYTIKYKTIDDWIVPAIATVAVPGEQTTVIMGIYSQRTGRLPDIGQTKCSDNEAEISCPESGETFFGQDASFLINPPSYTKLDENGNDQPDTVAEWVMVRDNVTGLIWEVKTDDGSIHDRDDLYTWQDAQDLFIAQVNAENYGNHSDWRLPNINELQSIVNFGTTNPSVNTDFFRNCRSSNYCSSSVLANLLSDVWLVSFDYGCVLQDGKNLQYFVRCVRDSSDRILDHLVINGDDTITDTSTGLLWQRATSVETNTWEGALSYADNLTLAGYDDWRLPNAREIQSIVNYAMYSPAIDTAFFPDTNMSMYWSGSSHGSDLLNAWSVYFAHGYMYNHIGKDNFLYVRCVRGGQSRSKGHLYIHTPVQASNWYADERMPITWETKDITGNVNISISRQGGGTGSFETIAEGTENDGVYEWAVTGPKSVNCMVKVEPVDDPGMGTTQGLFSIQSETVAPCGDVNKNERVDIGDAMFIAQYLVDNRNGNTMNLTVIDVNVNGRTDIGDAMFIAQFMVGNRDCICFGSPFEVCE